MKKQVVQARHPTGHGNACQKVLVTWFNIRNENNRCWLELPLPVRGMCRVSYPGHNGDYPHSPLIYGVDPGPPDDIGIRVELSRKQTGNLPCMHKSHVIAADKKDKAATRIAVIDIIHRMVQAASDNITGLI
jgi:hypothetical protein